MIPARDSLSGGRLKIVGIDPGKHGAICILQDKIIVTLVEMMDAWRFADMIEHEKPDVVYIEKAQAFPKNGAVAMFNYGRDFGQILGVLISLHIKHYLIPPATWAKKMHVGVIRSLPAKVKSLQAAKRLKPLETWREEIGPWGISESKRKVAHDGFVDAYLLAEYGRCNER